MCSTDHNFGKSTVTYLGASAISASLACILTYPSEVIRARLQAQRGFVNYNGIGHAFRKIWMTEGVTSLYRGLWTSLVKMTPAHAISFTVYEFILKCHASYQAVSSDFDVGAAPKNEIPRPRVPFHPLTTSHLPASRFSTMPNVARSSPLFSPINALLNNSGGLSTRWDTPQDLKEFACTASSVYEPPSVRWNEYFW